MRKALFAALTLLTLALPVAAEDRVTLGWGRMFVNDALGDTKDRWQTGSYTISRVRGVSWDGALPDRPGEILELRGRAQIIAPEDLRFVRPTDRRYAGILSFGLHTHFERAGWETALGADLVITGPQTGVGRFQTAVHDLLGLAKPRVLGNQIGNGWHPTLLAETGRSLPLAGGRATFRPFAEAQVGAEDHVRVGGDLTVGRFGTGALLLRDPVTGHRYQGVAGDAAQGFSFTLGGDVAHVFDSVYLPEGGPSTLSETRSRLRAGVHWQGESSSIFYGMTYLGPEFEEQPQGQFLGVLNLRIDF